MAAPASSDTTDEAFSEGDLVWVEPDGHLSHVDDHRQRDRILLHHAVLCRPSLLHGAQGHDHFGSGLRPMFRPARDARKGEVS